MKLEFSIYRYNPDVDDAPHMQDYTLEAEEGRDMMLLDALIQLKEKDPSLSFRRSCREGVCGSDGLNMNGKNGLACITPISALNQPGKKIVIRPLPGLPVIRDLVVDMGQFYAQYEKIKPYLLNAFSVFRCHSIMNCVSVCPKGLNPTRAIGHIKSMLLQRSA